MSISCLIVDDNADFLEAAKAALERQGMPAVAVATTAHDGLRRAGELDPEVILVDIDLGQESGFELTRRLAGAAGPAGPRVVLISAHSGDDFADLVAESPAVGFLAKSDLSTNAIRRLVSGSPGR
jgi:DNA-binding NarL/FixJ family response regulator